MKICFFLINFLNRLDYDQDEESPPCVYGEGKMMEKEDGRPEITIRGAGDLIRPTANQTQ
jgi:hypothetical protein